MASIYSLGPFPHVIPFPSPGDLPNPEIKPMSPALAGGFFLPLSHLVSPDYEVLIKYRITDNVIYVQITSYRKIALVNV